MVGFAVKTAGIVIVLWLAAFFGYGEFFLKDNIVPVEGMEVEEWLNAYRIAGGVSGVLAFLWSAVWYYIGDNYAGESGIEVKYYGLMVLSVLSGFAAVFFFLPPSLEGAGFSLAFVVLISFLTYYFSSLLASAEPVKFIPPLGETLH